MSEDYQQRTEDLQTKVSLLKERLQYQRKITEFLVGIHESPNPDFVPLSDLKDD